MTDVTRGVLVVCAIVLLAYGWCAARAPTPVAAAPTVKERFVVEAEHGMGLPRYDIGAVCDTSNGTLIYTTANGGIAILIGGCRK